MTRDRKPTIEASDLLEVLACDISARPPAPGPADLHPFVVGVVREQGALLVRFEAAGLDLLTRFVEAERECCPDIGWGIVAGPAVRISATPTQLDAITTLFE